MPTHASKAQKAQKRTRSLSERVLSASANALTAQTRLLSLAWRVKEDSLCDPSGGGGMYEVMAVYRSEPSIMQIMKEEKINPRGSATVGKEGEASCNDGTQTNTKRYIEPSKHVWVKPITNKIGSTMSSPQTLSVYTLITENDIYRCAQFSMLGPVASTGTGRCSRLSYHLCLHSSLSTWI